MGSRGLMPEESQSEQKARATKEELVAEIARLNTVIADLEDQIAQHTAAAKTGRSGWMISTPNPSYTGTTAGVYFENGHAFVPSDWKDAKKKVGILTNDFGYSASEVADGVELKGPTAKVQGVFEAVQQPQIMR